jgi:hypothetical protein
MKKHLSAAIVCFIVWTVMSFIGPETASRYDGSGSIVGSLVLGFCSVLFWMFPYLLAGIPLLAFRLPEWSRLFTVIGVHFLCALAMVLSDSDRGTWSESLSTLFSVTGAMWLFSLIYGMPLVFAAYYFQMKSSHRPVKCKQVLG